MAVALAGTFLALVASRRRFTSAASLPRNTYRVININHRKQGLADLKLLVRRLERHSDEVLVCLASLLNTFVKALL